MKAETPHHVLNLGAHTTDTSNPDDKSQCVFCKWVTADSFCFHPSQLNLHSVHLSIVLMTVLSFFIDKLPPCLLKHLLGKLLSGCLIFSSVKSFHFFLRVSGTVGTSSFFPSQVAGLAGTSFFFSSAPSMVPIRK